MISVRVAKSMKLDQEAIDMILHHHENYDGTGFPSGLKGEKFRWARELSRWRTLM